MSSPDDNAAMNVSTWEALELCGITQLAAVQVRSLSTGQRRLVELARCLAGPFTFLLLDEASSGLDAAETEAFGDVIETVIREREIGILLVEHDMDLVMRLSEHIYVLDFGRIIFDGTPDDVRESSTVRDAYLGDLTEQAAREHEETLR